MYWYLTGAVVCLAAALYRKRKALPEKKWYHVSCILAVGFLLAAVTAHLDGKEENRSEIARNQPGQGALEKEYFVDVPGELEDYPLRLEIAEKKLTKAQKMTCLEKAERELDTLIAGSNPSKDEVTESLYLPEYLQEGAVEATYQFSDYEIFHADGTLHQQPQKPTLVKITAELICQGETCLYQFMVQALPREKSSQEKFAEKLTALVSAQNEAEDCSYVKLPDKLEGKEVVWRQRLVNRSLMMVFLAAVAAAGIFLREKEENRRKKAARERQMMIDYAGIVGKFSLLLGAGMNISLAWEKIALAYQKKREQGQIEKRYAYEEMLNTLYEIRDGVGELQAYENFGIRCQLSIYRRLSALIVQNVRKGAQGMQRLLEQEEWEAYEQRKAYAKQMGEEAGTKLLLPMGIMLAIVLAILVIPAGMTLNI